jgi:putative membrane protein
VEGTFELGSKETIMLKRLLAATVLAAAFGIAAVAEDAKPSDPQIAHIAYTAGSLDVEAAQQALQKSKNPEVIEFAKTMERDHKAVNDQALALVKKLNVTPEDNPISQSLATNAAKERENLAALDGEAFDKAYIANEVAYHKAVNGALAATLIPSAQNAELKALLETGLTLFQQHQAHAEHLATMVE